MGSLVKPHGFMAQVTMQSWMFLSSYEKLRARLQRDTSMVAMLHMDNMVMRIAFGTCATIWEIGGDPGRVGKYTYLEVADLAGDGPRKFPPRNGRTATAGSDGYFTVSQIDFAAVPGAPIVYWLSEKMRAAFSLGTPLSEIGTPRNGLSTSDDAAFTRAWWEVELSRTDFRRLSPDANPANAARWFPLDKGGDFRRWYGNLIFVVNWENDGENVKNFIIDRYPYLKGNPGIKVRSTEHYFMPHVSFSSVSSGAPAFREYPGGTIFGGSAKAMFLDSESDRRELLGILNSQFIRVVLEAVAPTLNFESGQLADLPVVSTRDDGRVDRINLLVASSKADWESDETSWDFGRNPLVALTTGVVSAPESE